jgi:hypothetical protein
MCPGCGQKKTGTEFLFAGFTIRSLMPVVTTLGNQFIASTCNQSAVGSARAVPFKRKDDVVYSRIFDGTPGYLVARIFLSWPCACDAA